MSGQPFKLLPDQWTKQAITEHIIIHYRWVFVMFLLPISLGYDIYMALRSYVVFKLNSGKTALWREGFKKWFYHKDISN